MKKTVPVVIAVCMVFACKEKSKQSEKKAPRYPTVLSSMFEKHGGLDRWNDLKQLSFTKGNEAHTVDLQSRKTLIVSEKYAIGFDGKTPWLQEKDSLSFKGNKDFYYNLYFYFFAMPFVFADDGIAYEETKPLVFEGVSYPGIKISYKANIGASPDDNYYVYYNPASFQMEWLQYSVTFFSKKASTKVNTIRYTDWVEVAGILLPKAMTWYKKNKNGTITVPAGSATIFTNQNVSTKKADDKIFYKSKE